MSTDPTNHTVPAAVETDVPAATTGAADGEQEQAAGPLRSLARSAAATRVARDLDARVPDSARPTLERLASRAAPLVAAADEHLQTDEARELASASWRMAAAVAAFSALVLASALSCAESHLGIDAPHASSSPRDTSPPPADDLNGGRAKARALGQRFVRVSCAATKKAAGHVYARANKACGSTSERGDVGSDAGAETQEVESHKAVWDRLYCAYLFVLSAGAYALKSASTYTGPGGSYVAPVATAVIASLPEESKRAVRDSRSPLSPSDAPPASHPATDTTTDTTTESATDLD